MTNETPAGWYPAPSEPGLQRYWDGARWGDDRRPAPPQAPADSEGRRGVIVAAFVISIVALALSLIGGGFIPAIVSALMAGIPKPRRADSGFRTAALIMSLVAILLSIIIVFVRFNASR